MICCTSPPARRRRKICWVPERSESNTSHCPSREIQKLSMLSWSVVTSSAERLDTHPVAGSFTRQMLLRLVTTE